MLFYLDKAVELRPDTLLRDVFFYDLQVSFEKIYYTFTEEPDKIFCIGLKEKAFAFAGK